MPKNGPGDDFDEFSSWVEPDSLEQSVTYWTKADSNGHRDKPRFNARRGFVSYVNKIVAKHPHEVSFNSICLTGALREARRWSEGDPGLTELGRKHTHFAELETREHHREVADANVSRLTDEFQRYRNYPSELKRVVADVERYREETTDPVYRDQLDDLLERWR